MQRGSEAGAIVGGYHGDPFSYLGPHPLADGRTLVRVFQPGARTVALTDFAGQAVASEPTECSSGLFEIAVTGPLPHPYRLRVAYDGGTAEIVDPYQFGPWLGEMDLYLLREGTHRRAYDRLGAHLVSMETVEGVVFAVWAPNASRVSVVGDFNQWDERRHPMRLHPGAGIWEIFIPGLGEGERYKYAIRTASGGRMPMKADPFAFRAERPPATASIVCRNDRHQWHDQSWIDERGRRNLYGAPMTIYEVHLGSWRRRPDEGNRSLSYRELASTLVPYVRDMGFTHIEMLPIAEFPFDGSWGYQPTGLFAPTSRFGTPDEFQAFIDACHQAEIGVLLDWVPGHFPNDPHGLADFDGTKLYEHADPRRGIHRDWNTLVYNYGRTEVAEYLQTNALFWFDRFRVDGLRVDAVAAMLYLDYSRNPGEWIPNIHGGNEHLEAIAFLKRLNEACYATFSGITTVAEESTAWPMVSRPTFDGGLGFGFKWNMGWMHDTLSYMSEDPINRAYHHEKLTFGLLYAFTENFILPLSHDEVVHGKRSILGRMPGDPWQRFANLRAYYGFMYGHPGKKLLFMGNEFAQEQEWNHDRSLDWHLLADPLHQGVMTMMRDLNNLLRQRGALHQLDHDRSGFEWVDASDRSASVVSFQRNGRDGADHVVVIVNFTPVVRYNYRIGMPSRGPYVEIFNSDDARYGGSGVGNKGRLQPEAFRWHGRAQSMSLTLPPLAAVYLAPAAD
ncbi:MAG TPA: 1,4-alpha-glucan branching protein GlgB [Stellaceae bacterium]|jgi:1,4-alpha-glucan branching enzyme|nr:1,4-alpha-glucan branching protein GlgB [Stellaceae bacterium]